MTFLRRLDSRFAILLALSVLSVAAVFPYIVTVQGDILRASGQSLGVIFIAQVVQSAVLFAIAIYVGLRLAKKTAFRLPLLDAEKGTAGSVLRAMVPIAVVSGIGTACLIFGADAVFSLYGSTISTHAPLAPAWQTLLAAFYGGVSEEIVMRLFLMTLFVWMYMKVMRLNHATTTGALIAMILSAVIFGIGHLPITGIITQITPLIVVRAIVLNGIGGIVFGWLYWKRGLESAMIAHFTADVFLLTLLPLFV